MKSLSLSHQLPLTAELEDGLSKTNTAIHLLPPHAANRLHPTAGRPLSSGGRSIHLILIHSLFPLPVIFFTRSLLSVFGGPLFILTPQPVNLRSLDGHLSTPGHRGARGLPASLSLHFRFFTLSSPVASPPALPAGLKAPAFAPSHLSLRSFSPKC